MKDPKPCPLRTCESNDWSLIQGEERKQNFHIRCNNCEMRGPAGFSRDNAVLYWNELPRSSDNG